MSELEGMGLSKQMAAEASSLGALTQEQVEKEFIMQEIERLKRKDDPTTLRAIIEQQAQELERAVQAREEWRRAAMTAEDTITQLQATLAAQRANNKEGA